MNRGYPTGPVPSKNAAAFYAAYFGVLGVFLPFLGPFLQAREISAVGIGAITAAFSLAKLIYAPFAGAVVDRGIWRPGVLSAHLALAVGCATVVLWWDDPWLLGVAVFLVGLGYGTVLPLVEATILERLPAGGYGRLRLWGSLGFVVVSGISAPVVARGIDAGFPLLAAGSLVLLWITCVPFERGARPFHVARETPMPPRVWALLALVTMHQMAHGPYYAFFSIDLKENGISSVSISALWSLAVLAELVAFFSSRFLERRIGLLRVLWLALLLSPVRWLLLALPLSTSTLVVAQLGHAVTFASVHLAGVQLVQRHAPRGSVRRAQALYSGLSFGLGIVAGTAVAGPLYGAVGGRGAFLAAAILSAGLFLCFLPLAPRFRKGRAEDGDQKIT